MQLRKPVSFGGELDAAKGALAVNLLEAVLREVGEICFLGLDFVEALELVRFELAFFVVVQH